jgi:hypothetical protein
MAGVKCGKSKTIAAARFTRWLPLRASHVNTISVAFLICSTAILTVIVGVFGAYCAICGVLAAVNPSRPSHAMAALVARQSQASGD